MGKKQGRGLVENKSSFSLYTFRKFEMFTVIIKFFMKKDTDLCWAISPTQYKRKVFLCLDPCLITNVYIFSYCCWSVFVFVSISMDIALKSHSRKLLFFFFFRISVHFFIPATSWTNHCYATSFLGFKNVTSGGKEKKNLNQISE